MAHLRMQLLVIDPQNDFCDLPASYCPTVAGRTAAPALPVAGAHGDLQRLARLIEQGGGGLDAITLTLDTHQRVDIAHPTFWQQGDGAPVAPFTPISAQAVRAGQFQPRAAAALPRVLAYLDALEAAGRYTHMVWPVHCEIGSWGTNIHDDLRRACNGWEEVRAGQVHMVVKGLNPWTEHYSAVQAEVPDPADAGSGLNRGLLDRLRQADRLYIAGEAGSHCVKATTEHLVAHWPAVELGKLVLLTDCMSPVGGFEAQYRDFVDAMAARGLRLATSVEVLPELRANAKEFR